MNSVIQVTNEDGVLEEVEVIDFFQLDEFDHEYVLYTKNEEVGDNIVSYVSILIEVGEDEFQFLEITDPYELQKVEEEIEKEIQLLTEE